MACAVCNSPIHFLWTNSRTCFTKVKVVRVAELFSDLYMLLLAHGIGNCNMVVLVVVVFPSTAVVVTEHKVQLLGCFRYIYAALPPVSIVGQLHQASLQAPNTCGLQFGMYCVYGILGQL